MWYVYVFLLHLRKKLAVTITMAISVLRAIVVEKNNTRTLHVYRKIREFIILHGLFFTLDSAVRSFFSTSTSTTIGTG